MRRLLKKRELLAFYFLYKKHYTHPTEKHSVLEELQNTFNFSKKVAKNIVKRLEKLGLIKPVDETHVIITEMDEYLNDLLIEYIIRRKKLTKRMH